LKTQYNVFGEYCHSQSCIRKTLEEVDEKGGDGVAFKSRAAATNVNATYCRTRAELSTGYPQLNASSYINCT